MLTKEKLDKFVKMRNESSLQTNLQYSIDLRSCDIKLEDLGEAVKLSESMYCWNTPVGILLEHYGKLSLPGTGRIACMTTAGLFLAAASHDSDYPSISMQVGDHTVAMLEHCIPDDGQPVMLRVYSEENDEPISINWKTGEVIIPEEWTSKIFREGRGETWEI